MTQLIDVPMTGGRPTAAAEWQPIETLKPVNDMMVLFWTEFGPQLCIYRDADDEKPGWWSQMLGGSFYGIPIDGKATLWMLISAPSETQKSPT